MKPVYKKIFWVSLFAIAMGFMESAVVIYLREIYYNDGFHFPLKPIESSIARVEFFRELATIIMLIVVGYLSGKTKLQRFAYFNLAFAVWDIFYYVFLYIFLGWPESLKTWDILFLVPVPWVGPVWAPCLIALLMIIGSIFIIKEVEKNIHYKIKLIYWALLISGALTCILSFMWDYLQYSHETTAWSFLSDRNLFCEISNYVPTSFNFSLFLIGFIIMSTPVCYLIIEPLIKLKLKINSNK